MAMKGKRRRNELGRFVGKHERAGRKPGRPAQVPVRECLNRELWAQQRLSL